MDNLTLTIQIVILVGLSGVCSGLNVAIMSLDVAYLKRQVKIGNEKAKKVIKLRENSHLTLTAILFSNVAVNSTTAIILGNKFNGLVAGIASTMAIVIFGEVIPQALFARSALSFCAYLSPLLRAMIILTYPISKPLQILLDKLLGDEELRLHSRHELNVIINEHIGNHSNEIDDDEAEIMRGALSLSNKQVNDIATGIEKTYWLTPGTVIDSKIIDEIKDRNYSRIPIFNKAKTECYGVLLMKDLVDIDFDENPTPVEELKLHPTKIVGSKTALDTMFRKFIGARSHLIPVEKSGKIIGIVTIEDLFEEIIGHEIEDEADRFRVS
ncbi:DUF21 domain-containing protein [Candidatus Saccharibacteria bacterium]|nr:DUF21 domain-containing protein [Candidatus Saccharibacteria bacterium]